MQKAEIKTFIGNGVNQKGVRNHNERLILSVLQAAGAMSGSEVAKRTHLSAQTVSVIMRKLEGDGLVRKRKPVKGRVGKPSVPMALDPSGASAIGCKVGRRSTELFLTDFCGSVLMERRLTYTLPLPEQVFGFLQDCLSEACDLLSLRGDERLCGIGLAVPFEIWKWPMDEDTAPEAFLSWETLSVKSRVAQFTDLPVFLVNDATSGCWAENLYGCGQQLQNYAYLYVSTLIGGGIVLNGAVYEGALGNAGAFGPLKVGDASGQSRQLLDVASLRALEKKLVAEGQDPQQLWKLPLDWRDFAKTLDTWTDETARAIAQACISACAVIDFEAVVIDGHLPQEVRAELVRKVRHYLFLEDSRGLILPEIREGVVGLNARALGAAAIPVFEQYFLKAGRNFGQ